MRSYERNGVTVDQCSECRGVFLDRGELERLVDQEGAYYEQRGYREEPRREHKEHRGKPSKKKKATSFLSDLLEG
jgi:Zn-finger nucleic acid-binding protein